MAKTSALMLSLIAFSFFYVAFASDPNPLQDFCVAKNTSSVRVNGMVCKDPSLVTANDFLYRGAHIAGNTSNPFNFTAKTINVFVIPGLNTLGISMTRIDLAPFGVNPPHTHPRATEMIIVLEGSIFAGFITSSPENKLFGKVLNKGDVFVFPFGLVHFQYNVENSHAVAFNFLNSQNPDGIQIGAKVFGSNPQISSDVLAKAFQVDESIIDEIQSKFMNMQ